MSDICQIERKPEPREPRANASEKKRQQSSFSVSVCFFLLGYSGFFSSCVFCLRWSNTNFNLKGDKPVKNESKECVKRGTKLEELLNVPEFPTGH